MRMRIPRCYDESSGQSDSVQFMRGVIFDMDGVLVLSEPFIAKAAIRMFGEKGHTISEDEFRPFIGMGEDRFIGGVAGGPATAPRAPPGEGRPSAPHDH